MTSIQTLLANISAWRQPKEPADESGADLFVLSCQLSQAAASKSEMHGLNVGTDLEAFWLVSSGAELFKDEKYGQWGLRILNPLEVKELTSREQRASPDEVLESDFVIGEFYGDSEQLIIDSSRASSGEFPVLLRLPLYERGEWPKIAESFGEFLERYISSAGDKYWES